MGENRRTTKEKVVDVFVLVSIIITLGGALVLDLEHFGGMVLHFVKSVLN